MRMNSFFKVTCFFVFVGLISPTIGKAQSVVQNDAELLPGGAFGEDFGIFLSQSDTSGTFGFGVSELPDSQFSFTALLAAQLQSLYLCLLYTSPSPRDQRGSRMPSSA